jgi:DNA polymerase III epsilon subunit family exonuclease
VKWKHHKIVAFDVETTGLEPFDGDRVIEVGAIEFELSPDGSIANRTDHSWLINPERNIPRVITEITGIRNEDVENAPLFGELVPKLHEVFSGAVTVAHNYPFDLAFLTEEFRVAESWWPEPIAEVDTIDLSIRSFPDAKSNKLAALCERLEVTLEQAHRATDDAAACGNCFVKLVSRHHVPDDLQAMLDWAGAIGRPPSTGALSTNDRGTVVFAEGEHRGHAVAEHPVHLTWMCNARVRTSDGWSYRYDEQTRAWLRRWLQVRGSGRIKPKPKVLKPSDWGLDDYLAGALRQKTG